MVNRALNKHKYETTKGKNDFLRLWAQSRKRNRKAQYRCPSSLGGKFGKQPRSLLMIPSGSLPEVFGFIAQTLSQKGIILDNSFLFWDKVWATKPKTLGNKPEGIVNKAFGYVSQIFLPKTMANDTMPAVSFM